jgi:hypothetical protein
MGMATHDSLQPSLSILRLLSTGTGDSRRDDTVAYCGRGTPGTDSGLLITEKQDMECIRDQLLAFCELTHVHTEFNDIISITLFPSRYFVYEDVPTACVSLILICRLTRETIARAWNRGAALSCKD